MIRCRCVADRLPISRPRLALADLSKKPPPPTILAWEYLGFAPMLNPGR
jgi:hypothetical protein